MSLDKILKSRVWLIAWRVFSRLFVMLGLALLAWGADDLAGFLNNPVRAAFMVLVIGQTLFHGWLLLRIPPTAKHEHQHELEDWHYSLVELIYILAAFGDRRNILAWAENPALRWVGLGLYLLGALASTWASLTWVNHLRREPANALDNAVLLSETPYRQIRYPTLLALLLYGLGFALAFRSWVGLAFVVPLTGLIIRRINFWEKTYAARYKQVWASRCHTSKRIIPFLY